MAAVKEHLRTLNGKAAAHERRFVEMQVGLAERKNQGLLVDSLEGRIRALEDYVVAEKASEKTSAKCLK
jgi:hypothetical protein